MKKVLIITYYWPPSGGAGVQRWLKFSKYLRNYGWEPVIYTPDNPEAPAQDLSLLDEIPGGTKVIKTKIWEPYLAYKRFVGRKKEDKIKAGFLSENKQPSLTEKMAVWIRGNMFIPDARKYWIKPSIKFLTEYLSKHPVDAVVSTGPPHSMHMIALGVKIRTGLPWLADFRDPWTNIDFYDDLMLSGFADRKHRKFEHQVLVSADKVVTVSWNWAEDFEKSCNRKVDVVTNGFDPDDFSNLNKTEKSDQFILCHIGSLNKDRNPQALWKALGKWVEEDSILKKKLLIRFIGQVDYKVFEDLARFNLSENTEKIDYLPHGQTLKKASESSVLLLLLNNTPNVSGIIPGKAFEYIALKKPILCIGAEDGDTAKIIRECNAGVTIDFGDEEKIYRALQTIYDREGKAESVSRESINADKYSRVELTQKIAELLDNIV